MSGHKLSIRVGLSIFGQHDYGLSKIPVKLIDHFRPKMNSEVWNKARTKFDVRTPLDHVF
jgi:hypothetical protein